MQFPKINLNNWLKATFNDRPDIKKQYVNASFHVVQYTVSALNVLMRHLIDVQDLDTDVSKDERDISQLSAVFHDVRKGSIEETNRDYKWAKKWSNALKRERLKEMDEQKAVIAKDGYCDDGYSDGYSSLKISSDGSFNLKSDKNVNLKSDGSIKTVLEAKATIQSLTDVIKKFMDEHRSIMEDGYKATRDYVGSSGKDGCLADKTTEIVDDIVIPQVMKSNKERHAKNIKLIHAMLDRALCKDYYESLTKVSSISDEAFAALEKVVMEHPVLKKVVEPISKTEIRSSEKQELRNYATTRMKNLLEIGGLLQSLTEAFKESESKSTIKDDFDGPDNEEKMNKDK